MRMLHRGIKQDRTHGMMLFWVENMKKKTPEFERFPFMIHVFTWYDESQLVTFSHFN